MLLVFVVVVLGGSAVAAAADDADDDGRDHPFVQPFDFDDPGQLPALLAEMGKAEGDYLKMPVFALVRFHTVVVPRVQEFRREAAELVDDQRRRRGQRVAVLFGDEEIWWQRQLVDEYLEEGGVGPTADTADVFIVSSLGRELCKRHRTPPPWSEVLRGCVEGHVAKRQAERREATARLIEAAAAARAADLHSPLPVSDWRCTAQPAFVVGAEHSGTSIVLRLIAAHPNIVVPEGAFESSCLLQEPRRTAQAVALFTSSCEESASTKKWAEKTPAHNEVLLELLQRVPDARVVVVVRDGRDVALSMRRRFPERPLAALLAAWAAAVASAEPFFSRHPQVLLLRYESLVSTDDHESETTLRRLFAFLGDRQPPVDEILGRSGASAEAVGWNSPDGRAVVGLRPDGELDGEGHERLRNWQLNQPLARHGAARWRSGGFPQSSSSEDLRGALCGPANATVAAAAALASLGYDPFPCAGTDGGGG